MGLFTTDYVINTTVLYLLTTILCFRFYGKRSVKGMKINFVDDFKKLVIKFEIYFEI